MPKTAERLGRKNEFGKTDLTAFNAERINNPEFCIQYGGIKFLGREVKFSLDNKEVLGRLQKLGANITTERTLQNYVKKGLMPPPERKAAGRGRGKITENKPEAYAEAYASYCRLHNEDLKLPPEQVAEIRKAALELEKDPDELRGALFWPFKNMQPGDDEGPETLEMNPAYLKTLKIGGVQGMGIGLILHWISKRTQALAMDLERPDGKAPVMVYDIKKGEVKKSLELQDKVSSGEDQGIMIRTWAEEG